MTTLHDVAAALAPAIMRRIGEQRYRLWFADNTRFAWDGQELTVGVPNRFYQEWLQNTFTEAVQDAAREELAPHATVHFHIDPALFQATHTQKLPVPVAPAQLATAKTVPAHSQRRWLALEDFVVGACNRLAHAAVLARIERPDGTPNLVTVHGPSGVGKTHLLEAAHFEWQRTLGAGPLFVTAEDFTNRFLHALKANKIGLFRKEFREAHALVVDDIHFLARKDATQEEFVHTLDTLRRLGRPVIVSCDCHPKILIASLPELANRLLAGGVWGVEPPEYDTRRAILTAKAQRLGYQLPDECLSYLVEQLCGNVRELEGALHTIHHVSTVHRQPITLHLVREAIRGLVRPNARLIQVREIDHAVCETFGLPPRSLQGKSRVRAVSHARMIAMFLARRHTAMTYLDIGRFFGGRNYSTVIAAEAKVRGWIEKNEALTIADRSASAGDVIALLEQNLSVAS